MGVIKIDASSGILVYYERFEEIIFNYSYLLFYISYKFKILLVVSIYGK